MVPTMRPFLIILAWLSLARSGFAEQSPVLKKNPDGEIYFAKVTQDFGTLKRGERVSAEFNFENVGKGDLVIQGAHASCGCTAVEAERGRVYGPGEKGVIKLVLDSANFAGPLVKLVTVLTNDKVLPARTLTVKAQIIEEIVATPPIVDFGVVQVGHPATRRVIVSPKGDKKQVKVSSLEFNSDVLQGKFEPVASGWAVEVGLSDTTKPGYLKETLYVHNDSEGLPALPILVRAEVLGNVRASPSYLEFGAVASNSHVTRFVQISAPKGLDITGTRVELRLNGEAIENPERFVSLGDSGDQHKGRRIPVNLHNFGGKAGSVHGQLVFLTTDPWQKEVAFDLYALFQ